MQPTSSIPEDTEAVTSKRNVFDMETGELPDAVNEGAGLEDEEVIITDPGNMEAAAPAFEFSAEPIMESGAAACPTKPDGPGRVHARFGRKRTHNEELCVE